MHMAFELEFVWDESSLVQEHFFPSDPFWAVLKTIIDSCDAVAAACFAVCFVVRSSFLASSPRSISFAVRFFAHLILVVASASTVYFITRSCFHASFSCLILFASAASFFVCSF